MAWSDRPDTEALHRVSLFASALLLPWAFAGCEETQPGETRAAATECAPGAELAADLYGPLEGELAWRSSALDCEGMRRPHGEGARLRFEGPAPQPGEATRLAFIIALPDLVEGRTAKELPAGVTLMEVDAGRFFNSPEQAGCWADVERQEPLGGGDWLISGLVYCVSPLAEVNGASSITLRDLRFTGRLDWSEPE